MSLSQQQPSVVFRFGGGNGGGGEHSTVQIGPTDTSHISATTAFSSTTSSTFFASSTMSGANISGLSGASVNMSGLSAAAASVVRADGRGNDIELIDALFES
jgi:hypothetical protein